MAEAQIDAAAKRRTKPAAERRKDVLDAALKLFRERGYNETTVQDIAEAAGVAIGTVYIHYSSKEHVLAALHERFHTAMAEELAEAGADILERQARGETIDLGESVGRLLDLTAAYMTTHREACEVVMKYLPGPEVTRGEKVFIEFLTRLLEEAIREGVAHASDPEMFARLMSAAIGFTTASCSAYSTQ